MVPRADVWVEEQDSRNWCYLRVDLGVYMPPVGFLGLGIGCLKGRGARWTMKKVEDVVNLSSRERLGRRLKYILVHVRG